MCGRKLLEPFIEDREWILIESYTVSSNWRVLEIEVYRIRTETRVITIPMEPEHEIVRGFDPVDAAESVFDALDTRIEGQSGTFDLVISLEACRINIALT